MSPITRPLWQRFLVFVLPMMLANVLQSLSGTINSIYVGQMIGVEALAAASVFFPIMLFLISFIIGLSSGATVLIGQAWGARNVTRVKQIAGTALTVAFLMGVVVALIGVFFTGTLMGLLGAPENIRAMATGYGQIMLVAMPGFFVFLIATSILRGVGDVVTPLWTLLLSIVIGLMLTPALIAGWGGLPRVGVDAAAIATVAGWLGGLVLLFFYLRARKHPLAPDVELGRALKIDMTLLPLMAKLGIPAALQMVVGSIAAIVVVGLVNTFGSDATAAYGAVNQVLGYVQFPAMTIAIASSIFASQAIGAGQASQLGAITRTGLVMNILITGGFVLAAYLLSESLVRLFITDEAVVAETQVLLHIVLWSTILFGAASVYAAIMRASGVVLVPMVISIGAVVAVEIPVAILFSRWFGLEGIWWAYVLSFGVMLAGQAAYFHLVWRKKTIVAMV